MVKVIALTTGLVLFIVFTLVVFFQQIGRPRRVSDSQARIVQLNPSDNLQTAINRAVPGDIIVLPAGARYVGSFTLPRKDGNGYVTIQSSRAAELPEGSRVSPAQSELFAKLVSPGLGEPVLRTAPGAHHYRFIGIEIAPKDAKAFVYTLVELGSAHSDQNSLDKVPHDFIFDRCYIHGFPSQNIQRGIALNSAETSVLNSWISDIHWDIDTQALCGWNGPGPFHIINNHLEAAGENVMFGGATVQIPKMIPSDIEIRRNHFFKPLSWKVGDPSYGGIHWSVKNHFELKNARRVTLEGNLFENVWGDAQDGFSVQLTPRQDPYAVVEDVTFINNIFRNAGGGINFLGVDNYGGGPQQTRIKVLNNLFEPMTGSPLFQISHVNDLVIDHNTAIHPGNIITHYGAATTGFVFTNNIVQWNQYGIIADGSPPIAQYFPGAVIRNNITVTSQPQYFPVPGNFLVANLADIGFVDVSGRNYRLANSSRFRRRAHDRKDPGVDMDALAAAMSDASPNTNQRRVPTSPSGITSPVGTKR